ncbi:hypothetical protein BDK51DRAFT_44471 [Blyttiomyces helicus]|uniref:Uncharacterized protein n=1 Tax=Blyttiomyces helicus TaxID=388810 RepID=A0A4P9WJU0_9FUNG|nr:hypothetical protein BDK51DRAFT_44471 [Blyttiomyces helicus]|eukprot:RKO92335.1 hypothetical protein BDK51DRAFT_44471 [Blyttiomyces helicus]
MSDSSRPRSDLPVAASISPVKSGGFHATRPSNLRSHQATTTALIRMTRPTVASSAILPSLRPPMVVTLRCQAGLSLVWSRVWQGSSGPRFGGGVVGVIVEALMVGGNLAEAEKQAGLHWTRPTMTDLRLMRGLNCGMFVATDDATNGPPALRRRYFHRSLRLRRHLRHDHHLRWHSLHVARLPDDARHILQGRCARRCRCFRRCFPKEGPN